MKEEVIIAGKGVLIARCKVMCILSGVKYTLIYSQGQKH